MRSWRHYGRLRTRRRSTLPKNLPPKSTAHFYLMLWDWDGTLERIHDALYAATRQAAGREASPRRNHRFPIRQGGSKRGSAIDPQGFDAGKKVTDRKRHILVDTLGLLLGVSILPANIQDRDGSLALLHEARRRFPFVERIFADAEYQGPKMANVVASSGRDVKNLGQLIADNDAVLRELQGAEK